METFVVALILAPLVAALWVAVGLMIYILWMVAKGEDI